MERGRSGSTGVRPGASRGRPRARIRRGGALLTACLAAAVCTAACGKQPAAGGTAGPSARHASAAASSTRSSSSAPASASASGASTLQPSSSSSAPVTSTVAPAAGAGSVSVPVPFAVTIGNDPGARPQAGLDQAKEVWEILDEGWITRYLAIFAGTAPSKIGPVRSTRIYNDQLVHAMGIPLAHAGGSADGLAYIPTWHIENIDDIYGSGAYFWRGASRIAPDNLYTSGTLIASAERAYGFRAATVPYPAAGTPQMAGTPTAGVTLTYIHVPTYAYAASWTWDGAAGVWLRSVNGSPDVQQDGRRVQAGTVIILRVRQAHDPNDNGNPLTLYMLWQDGGSAWVLRGSESYRTTWALGASGVPVVGVPAGPGPYWYEVVPSSGDVSLQTGGA